MVLAEAEEKSFAVPWEMERAWWEGWRGLEGEVIAVVLMGPVVLRVAREGGQLVKLVARLWRMDDEMDLEGLGMAVESGSPAYW